MANQNIDVIRVEDTAANLPTTLINGQLGHESDGDRRLLWKDSGGSSHYYNKIADANPTDIVIADNSATAFRVREASNNYVLISTLDGAGTITFGTEGTDAVIIDKDQQVGIGVAPSTKLHVLDTVEQLRLSYDGTHSLRFVVSDSTGSSLYNTDQDRQILVSGGNATSDGANITVFGSSHAALADITRFRVGVTDTMRIIANGNVGIGETSPDEMLHLTSSASAKPVLKIEDTNADANSAIIEFNKNSASQANDDVLGLIEFRGNNSTPAEFLYAKIEGISTNVAAASETSEIKVTADVLNMVGLTSSQSVIQSDEIMIVRTAVSSGKDLWIVGEHLLLNPTAAANVTVFENAGSSETPSFQISGYRSGDALRTLSIGASSAVNDQFDISGVSSIKFSDDVVINKVLCTTEVLQTISSDNDTNLNASEGSFLRVTTTTTGAPTDFTVGIEPGNFPGQRLTILMNQDGSQIEIDDDVTDSASIIYGSGTLLTMDGTPGIAELIWSGAESAWAVTYTDGTYS